MYARATRRIQIDPLFLNWDSKIAQKSSSSEKLGSGEHSARTKYLKKLEFKQTKLENGQH